MKRNKLVGSSANPENISLTIKGIAVALIPTIIFLGGVMGFSLAEADLTQLVSSLTTIASAIMVAYGLCRKIYIGLKK